MANVIVILGQSGTGKSTSIRTLNPEETIIINPLKKLLPFKGASKMYSVEKNNYLPKASYGNIIDKLKEAHSNPKVKNIIIDDKRQFLY